MTGFGRATREEKNDGKKTLYAIGSPWIRYHPTKMNMYRTITHQEQNVPQKAKSPRKNTQETLKDQPKKLIEKPPINQDLEKTIVKSPSPLRTTQSKITERKSYVKSIVNLNEQ